MIIKRNILFFIDKEGNLETGYKPDGKLRLRIRFASTKVDFNVGYRVDIAKWSTETQRCKSGTTHGKKKVSALEINNEVQRLETLADTVFKAFEVKNLIPTPKEYRETFNRVFKGEVKEDITQSVKSFLEVFDEFVNESGTQNNWTIATSKKFRVVRNHLTEFNEKIVLTFGSISDSVLSEYVIFLRDTKNMRNTTIDKQIKFVKWFLRWAFAKGYHSNNTFEMFKPKLKLVDKKIIFLTWEELTKLREYKIPNEKQYLERVRDVFLFQCFTGLRHSDVYNLKRSDIKADCIDITTIKTADRLLIELNDHSRAILNKYEAIHFEDGKVLPVISNQKMNDYLKELAELAEINEPVGETYYKGSERIDTITPKYALLGTHAGRRTFICSALALGVLPQVVMKWTGHSNYQAMKPYIDVADDIKAQSMNVFNQL